MASAADRADNVPLNLSGTMRTRRDIGGIVFSGWLLARDEWSVVHVECLFFILRFTISLLNVVPFKTAFSHNGPLTTDPFPFTISK